VVREQDLSSGGGIIRRLNRTINDTVRVKVSRTDEEARERGRDTRGGNSRPAEIGHETAC